MRIGVDIDDTICCTSAGLTKMALEFDEKFVNGRGFKNKHGETLMEKFYWNVYHVDAFLKMLNKGNFYSNLDVKEEANKYVTKLYDEGYEIIFITRRLGAFFPSRKTKKWLKENGFKYNDIVFDMVDKGAYCKKNGIDLLVDNDFKNIDEALKYGVDAILMEDDNNKNIRKYKKMKNWKEIYEYISGVK